MDKKADKIADRSNNRIIFGKYEEDSFKAGDTIEMRAGATPTLIYKGSVDADFYIEKSGQSVESNSLSFVAEGVEIIRIDKNGNLFWNNREITTDDDFKVAMRDLADKLIIA